MFDVRRRRHIPAFAAFSLLLTVTSFTAAPELKHLYPAAGQQGTQVAVAFAGKFDPWPPQVWTDASGVTFTPTPITGTFNVEIAAEAEPGPHLVRIFNEEGASIPRFFIVSAKPELRDREPNDDFKAPQPIAALPATISGRLDKSGDAECFAVTLKKDETLVAWVEAYVLASTCDALLRIVDTSGHVLAFNHDGRTLDPFLAWPAPHDGTFIVQLMAFAHPPASSVQLAGGEGCVYRLHVTAGPFVRHTMPLAVPGKGAATLRLMGWNLPASEMELSEALAVPARGNAAAVVPLPGVSSVQPLMITGIPEAIEQEPNDSAAAAGKLEAPCAVSGQISAAGDEDRYTFTALKGRIYELKLLAGRLGSGLDAWLKVEGADGKELVRDDDGGGARDPRLLWTAPANGAFTIAVGDLTHSGGEDFVYRLAVAEPPPYITATTATPTLALEAGKTEELKVTVKRLHGFKGKLQLAANKLPAGVSAPAVEVPEKDGEVTLKIIAEPATQPANRPMTLVLREIEGGREHPVRFPLAATSEDNGVPQGYADLVVNATEHLWLTITAPAKK